MRSPVATVASLLLAGSLVLSGCSLLPGEDEEPAPKPKPVQTLPSTAWRSAEPAAVASGGTLRLGAATLPRNLNPLHADSANSDAVEILAPTTGGAVRITENGGWEVDPDYAESVEVSDEDPLTIEVELNRNAVWQGGTSITARDMIAFWQAMNGSDDDFEVISTIGYQDIASVTRGENDFSYTVTFDQPTAEWPQYIYPRLAANVSSSPKLFNSAFRRQAVSSNGPYVVESIDAREGVIIQKPNPRWWGARPKLATIRWNVAEPALQAEAYAAGELDAVDLEGATYDVGRKRGVVQRAAGIEWSQVTLNGARGPLSEPRVRRAVARAINRDPIATASAGDLGAPAQTLGSVLLVPGQEGYRDSADEIAYDPAAAERLLVKAGYAKSADGVMVRDGEPLTLTMPVPQDTPTNSRRARAIVSDLAKVGITVTLRSVPAARYFDRYIIPLEFDLVTFVRRGSAFPIASAEPIFYPVDSPQNYTGLGAGRFGEGWDVTLGTLEDGLRARRVAKLDEWLFQDVPMIPLAVTPIAMALRKDLVNYGAAQFEQPDWTQVGFLEPADD